MIHRVEFRNFKALRHVSVELAQFTVFVGPNASGKSSVLEGLRYLAGSESQRLQDTFDPRTPSLYQLISSGADGEMSLYCESDGGWLRLARDPQPGFQRPPSGGHAAETLDLAKWGVTATVEKQRGGALLSGHQIKQLGPAALLRLDINRLAAPSYSDQAVPHLESDGTGLASVLTYLTGNDPATYDELLGALREIMPFVRKMRFPRAKIVRQQSEVITVDEKAFTRQVDREFWGNAIEFDMEGASRIPAHAASEGTLLVLGLLTTFLGPNRPRLALLDDIDRGLHPRAQVDLVRLLRRLLERQSDLQIVATSHSPYLLDEFEPQEVRLTTLDQDGSVVCGRLDEHPEFEKWKELMTPGEFWSHVGEKWLVDVNDREPAK